MPMLLHSLKIQNLLSFGPDSKPMEFGPLNVVIGANGSGKSNLLDVISLLQAAPTEITRPIREGGGIHEWLWKGAEKTPTAVIEAVVDHQVSPEWGSVPYRYTIEFTTVEDRFNHLPRFTIEKEKIESTRCLPGFSEPHFYYKLAENNIAFVNLRVTNGFQESQVDPRSIQPEKSVLATLRDLTAYPEITGMGELFKSIRIHRNWSFGRNMELRKFQPADLMNRWLDEDGANLGLMLNRFKSEAATRGKMLEFFRALYADADDFDVSVQGGMVLTYVLEGGKSISAFRLSDGTMRYLCLLAVLCDPNPPSLICIDEPDLGLHPDLIRTVAKALRYAAERTQVIVTTHSTTLVDAFTDIPEVIQVCERGESGTEITRLDPDQLAPWLKDYRLGALWTSGEIGGNRW